MIREQSDRFSGEVTGWCGGICFPTSPATGQTGVMTSTPTSGSRWPAVGRSDVGRVRKGNEDAFACLPDRWIVADGLGGHAGGEIASAAATKAALEALPEELTDASPRAVLNEAFARAHDAIRAAGAGSPGARAMGSTLVVAYADASGNVHVGSVGDSRAYWLSDGRLRQLTRDDNLAEELLAAGAITAEEARTHPGQFMLTRALIADDPRIEEPQIVSISTSGRLLLCSDGLNAELDDREIALLLGISDLDEAADALVQAALEAGGSDNVTVVIVDVRGR